MPQVKSKAPFRPVQRRRIHEDVATQLRDAILDRRYRPGEKLPPERELAAEFQVNRTSIREAIKVLEGLRLVTVRQGDGATVQPLIEGSLDLIAPMVFRRERIDAEFVAELAEVMMPLLLEMGRLAIERRAPRHLAVVRRLRDAIADESRDRDERFASSHELLVALSDMTDNRVWQMLARRTRSLLASEPLIEARRRLRRDPGRLVPVIDDCLAAVDAGRGDEAVVELQRIITLIGDTSLTPGPYRASGARAAAVTH